MIKRYVCIKEIDGQTFIAVGRPDAKFDVLFPVAMAREMKYELIDTLAEFGSHYNGGIKIVK